MSDASTNAAGKSAIQRPLPAWLTSGVLGMTLGVGATYATMYYHYGPEPQTVYNGPGANTNAAAAAPGGGMMGGGGGMMGGGMGGGGMGGGGMGGGGMGGGGMGGGPRGKRNLTSIVGKLALLSKGISFQLDGEQTTKLASQLADLDQAETMTQEEAQERVDGIEAILTDEQKDTLAQINVPRGGAGGGQGGGGPGGQMAGGAPPGGMGGRGGGMAGGGGGGGGGGGSDDSNPFQQETNQTRLRSLLDRLKVSSAETTPSSEKTEAEGSRE